MPDREITAPGGHSSMKISGPLVANHETGVRTLGLIGELQDYIDALENVAASRKVELDRIRDQKHGVEKMLYHFQQRDGHMRQGELFTSLERADMPPRIRAILEDNKMLVDKVRKYKSKCHIAERMIVEQRQQFTMYQDEILKLRTQKKALRVRSPQARNQPQSSVQHKQRITVLEHQVEVLSKKNETDAKQFKYILSGLRKENESLQRHSSILKATVQEKEHEIRVRVIEAKQAQRAHAEVKRLWDASQKKRKSCRLRASTAPLASTATVPMSEDQSTSYIVPQFESCAEMKAKPREPVEANVCVMLCVIHANIEQCSESDQKPAAHLEGSVTTSSLGGNTESIPSSVDKAPGVSVKHTAATKIQSNYREFKARKELAGSNDNKPQAPSVVIIGTQQMVKPTKVKQTPGPPNIKPNNELTDDALDRAAIKIQSAARGMQARKRVKRLKLDKLAADVASPKKVKSTAHHSNWIYRHQQQHMQGKSKKPSGPPAHKA